MKGLGCRGARVAPAPRSRGRGRGRSRAEAALVVRPAAAVRVREWWLTALRLTALRLRLASIVGLRRSSYTPVPLLSCRRSALRSREIRRPRSPRTRDCSWTAAAISPSEGATKRCRHMRMHMRMHMHMHMCACCMCMCMCMCITCYSACACACYACATHAYAYMHMHMHVCMCACGICMWHVSCACGACLHESLEDWHVQPAAAAL